MFGELPRIFERDFVVGYVLPSALFLLVSLGFTHGVDLLKLLTTADGASFAVVAFALGIVLLAANRSITRILEGYGGLNPAKIMKRVQRWRFRRLKQKLEEADNLYLSCENKGEPFPEKEERERQRLMTRVAERYPHEERLVLPTSFGNCMRSFESYPLVMYNLGIIEVWSRLIAVIPKEYLDLIDTGKAGTDMWVNLWFLSLVTIADAVLTSRHLFLTLTTDYLTPYVQPLLTIVGALGVAFFASWMAARAAIEWGSTVKAAVDVYLPALYDRLGFPEPASNAEAERNWDAFSDAISYRIHDAMPERRWVVPTSPPGSSDTTLGTSQAAPASPNSRYAVEIATTSALIALSAVLGRAKEKNESLTEPLERASGAVAPSQNKAVASHGGAKTPAQQADAGSSLDKTREKES